MRAGYRNKERTGRMRAVGLIPSGAAARGGKEAG